MAVFLRVKAELDGDLARLQSFIRIELHAQKRRLKRFVVGKRLRPDGIWLRPARPERKTVGVHCLLIRAVHLRRNVRHVYIRNQPLTRAEAADKARAVHFRCDFIFCIFRDFFRLRHAEIGAGDLQKPERARHRRKAQQRGNDGGQQRSSCGADAAA